jgi:hypothetical protein
MEIVAFSKKDLLTDFMRHKLAHDDYWLEVAIRILYGRQTKDEKFIRTTIYKNMKGFNKPDALAIADIIVRYVLLNDISSTDRALLQKLLPKYAKQLYLRTDKAIQDKLETEIVNPITRAGFKVSDKELSLVQDKGSYNRNEMLGDDPSLAQKPGGGLILTRKKLASELLKIARLLAE